MFFKLPLTIPARFGASILQIIVTGILLMYRSWNLNNCESILNDSTLSKLKEDQYIVGLSLIIGLTSLQIISLVFGLTLYSNLTNILNIGFHVSGVVSLLFFMFSRSCVDLIWPIFGTCSALPFFIEIVSIIRIFICKRLPAY